MRFLLQIKRFAIRVIKPPFKEIGSFVYRYVFSRAVNSIFIRGIIYRQVQYSHRILRRNYRIGEKIVIVFIFQSPSFWPSWESLWSAVSNDARYEAHMLVCDDEIKEKVQFTRAREFLTEKNIPFRGVHDIHLKDLHPHIVVLHTPYDGGHRPRFLHGDVLKAAGYRTVYITYGIEISDSDKARSDHFLGKAVQTLWRGFTFSPLMISEYNSRMLTNNDAIRSLGHPKFDSFHASYPKPSLPESIASAAGDRPIILWKVHFPKRVFGKQITPEIEEYLKFIDWLKTQDNLFFVFMPHPKFFAELQQFSDVEVFKAALASCKNLVTYDGDDYRSALQNVDFIITDRSAIMIEAALTEKPILYVQNDKYKEPLTPPVQRLVDTYYSADGCADMIGHIQDVFIKNDDYKRESRLQAIAEVLVMDDTPSGRRIADHLYQAMNEEADYS
ncbi:MAG: CDP-glycerol glycerophosphotransferase family protein [Nitratireductor sp.]|nr:CDP-glycerol glycerophosphotransferase family protein [Nitratireductor sp.]